jgi:hypothetical protein
MKSILVKTAMVSIFIQVSFGLSVKEYVSLVRVNDMEYQNIGSAGRQMRDQLRSAKGLFGWTLSSKVSVSKADYVSYAVSDSNSLSGEVTVAKLFEGIGTRLSTSYGYSSSEMIINSTTSLKEYKPYLSVSLTQPLVKNFLGKSSDFPKKNMGLFTKVTELQDLESKESYLEKQLVQYYNWILLTQALEITGKYYENTLKLHKEIRIQYRRDFITESDYLQSEENLAKMLNQLSDQLLSWNQVTERMCRMAGLPFTPATKWRELSYRPEAYTLDEISGADVFSRLGAMYDLRQESLVLQRTFIKDQAAIALDLFGSYKAYDSSTSETGALGTMDKADYAMGVSLFMPLENDDGMGKLQENDELISQLLLERDRVQRDLDLAKASIDRAIEENKNTTKRLTRIESISKKRTLLEQKRYRTGKIPFNQLVLARNGYLTNQQALLSSTMAGYQLHVQRMSLSDVLLDKVSAELKLNEGGL